MKYALIQNGYAIFGVGNTEDEACENAREWLENPDEAIARAKENEIVAPYGEFFIAPITDELAEKVEIVGGDVTFFPNDDGIFDVCED